MSDEIKTEVYSESEEKRIELIYNIINNRFNLEWQRSDILDGKASSIIGFVGVIVSLETWIASIILEKMTKFGLHYAYTMIVFGIILVLLINSLLYSLRAYRIQFWRIAPETNHLINEYAKTGRSRQDILRTLSVELSESISHNKRINDKKIGFINKSYIFLIVGIAVNIIFIAINII